VSRTTRFVSVRASLADCIGTDATDAMIAAFTSISREDPRPLRRLARKPVDFFPQGMQRILLGNLERTGTPVSRPLKASPSGAAPRGFDVATSTARSPLCGFGFHRVGEDGRLYFIAKSEHYHTPLGHAFPGYELLRIAQRIGIPNATHNNTRGLITRRLEQELVRCAGGLDPADASGLSRILRSSGRTALNRVLNLETGSLAAEAAFKMMLARFFLVQDGCSAPAHPNRTPVFIVMGDDQGGIKANYHGTTILTQVLRGMWPGLRKALESHKVLKVVPVRPNNLKDLESAFTTFNRPPYGIAGFLHEIVLMNYGAVRLSDRFLRRAYTLAKTHDGSATADPSWGHHKTPELMASAPQKHCDDNIHRVSRAQ
jgi:hypothetical protein